MLTSPNRNPTPEKMRFTTGLIPSLDGWRALSVALVLFAHGQPPPELKNIAFFCGAIGVKFFFVISGFLITWLLLREHQTQGTINLVAFYKRRAYRILPVYYLFLLVYAIAERHSEKQISISQWIANITFSANYSSAEGPTGHLWTLGVEEQFYLIWPFLFLMVIRKNSQTAWQSKLIYSLLGILIICPLIRGGCYLIPKEYLPLILNRFSFLRHADEIGWGCMSAVLFWIRPKLWDLVDRYQYTASIVGLILILIPWFAGPINGFNLINVPLGPSMQCAGYAALMLCSISNPKSLLFVWLNTRPLITLGTLSYSIYIWHTMFIPQSKGWPTLTIPQFIEFPWWILMVLAMAACSFWGLEKPFLSLRRKLTTHR